MSTSEVEQLWNEMRFGAAPLLGGRTAAGLWNQTAPGAVKVTGVLAVGRGGRGAAGELGAGTRSFIPGVTKRGHCRRRRASSASLTAQNSN